MHSVPLLVFAVLLLSGTADARTLVLIDELGAGTDPDEGAAIGQAIVEELLERRCPAMVVTTDARVPQDVVEEIVASDGFVNGWSVDLG